jgi:hypothetical protein
MDVLKKIEGIGGITLKTLFKWLIVAMAVMFLVERVGGFFGGHRMGMRQPHPGHYQLSPPSPTPSSPLLPWRRNRAFPEPETVAGRGMAVQVPLDPNQRTQVRLVPKGVAVSLPINSRVGFQFSPRCQGWMDFGDGRKIPINERTHFVDQSLPAVLILGGDCGSVFLWASPVM